MDSIDEKFIRKIIHVDMDAFYASVEQRDNPELRGRPVAVGGSKDRGVVAAASYEARAFGVRSAMASKIAIKKCPNLVFVKPNFEKYKEVSDQIHEVFYSFTDLVEPLSLDEAFLDVTENKRGYATASKIAKVIRQEIFETTGLTASAGISINKFLAKVASDINKPNGQKTILPENVIPFLEALPVRKFFGVGQVTANTMHELGIFTGADLKKWALQDLIRNFGKSGKLYFDIVRGVQHAQVQPHRLRKSIGAERTFDADLTDDNQLLEGLNDVFKIWLARFERQNIPGKTIALKLKDSTFTIQTRSFSFENAVLDADVLWSKACDLLQQSPVDKNIRLIGLTLSNLQRELPEFPKEGIQLTLDF
ncbi:MAG: DNA polymerase IV [Schleiferiaceae bacterium]|nr:DNA polymerase IV [Schleiferiaceae bacterium]